MLEKWPSCHFKWKSTKNILNLLFFHTCGEKDCLLKNMKREPGHGGDVKKLAECHLPCQYLNGNDPTNVLSQRGNLRKFENNRSFIHSTPINIEKRPSINYYIKNKIKNYLYFQSSNGF